MSAPTVRVVIPAYRAAHFIGRAIDSVLAQTRPADEILVVDDGSPDDLAAALAPYGGRVRLLRKANGGASSARNFGVEHCPDGLIAFLDADDYWEPPKLERQLEILTRHPRLGVVASRFYVQPPTGGRYAHLVGHPSLYDRVWDRPAGPIAFELARRVWTSTLLVRRDALGGLRFDEGLSTAEDVDMWVRLVASTPAYLISEPLATGVQEPGSLSRGSDPAHDCRNMLAVVRRYTALLGPAATRVWEAQVYREWAALQLGGGRPGAALYPACVRLLREPWRPQAWWIVFKSAAWAAGRQWFSRDAERSALPERSAPRRG